MYINYMRAYSLFLSLSLSVTRTHTLTHTHSLTHSHFLSSTHTRPQVLDMPLCVLVLPCKIIAKGASISAVLYSKLVKQCYTFSAVYVFAKQCYCV